MTEERLSEILRVCISLCRDVMQHIDNFETFKLVAPDSLATLRSHLWRINRNKCEIQPLIEGMNRYNTVSKLPLIELDDKKYLSVHEAALSIVELLLVRTTLTFNYLLKEGEENHKSNREIMQGKIMQILEGAKRMPNYQWNDLDVELRREFIRFRQATPNSKSTDTDSSESLDLKEDNADRRVDELAMLLQFIEQEQAAVAEWRDKAGFNGFRLIEWQHVAEQIPRELKKHTSVLELLTNNLKLWPEVPHLRTLAEAEGQSFDSSWFRKWKAKAALAANCTVDEFDSRRIADVLFAVDSGDMEETTLTEQQQTTGQQPDAPEDGVLPIIDSENRKSNDLTAPPRYDPDSDDWITSERIINLLGIKSTTLANGRKPSVIGKDQIDEHGKWNTDAVGVFRREVNAKKNVAYYRPQMSNGYKAKLMEAEKKNR